MKATEIQKQRMKKQYYKNREKRLEECKKNYQKNKDYILKRQKDYYENNKEKISLKSKENYIWNRFERIIRARKYYQEHKEEILKNMSEFGKQNRDIMNKKRIIYEQKYPEKVRARNIAKYRIEIPKNQICEICDINKATDREHRDYSKPLEVSFVCHQCNCKFERAIIC